MNEVKLRYTVIDGGTIRVLERAGKELTQLERKAVSAGDRGSIALGGLRKGLGGIAAIAQRAGVAVGAVAAGSALALRGQLNLVDEITKQARASGTAVQELSSLRTAADLSGSSIGELGQGLAILNRRLVESASGVGRSQNVLAALRVEFRDSEGQLRGNIDVLKDVADRFSQLPDGPQKTAAAMELFGRSGAKFINLLNLGSAGIANLQKENARLGLTFDATFGERVEAVNDNLDRMRKAGEGLALTFLGRVTPSLEAATSGLTEFLDVVDSATPDDRLGQLIGRQLELQQQLDTFNSPTVLGALRLNFTQGVLGQEGDLFRSRDNIERELGRVESDIEKVQRALLIRARRGESPVRPGLNDDSNVNDALLTQKEINDALSRLGTIADESAPKVGKVTDEYGRLRTVAKEVPSALAGVRSELERTATIELDFGDAFRRLTTGGGSGDIGDVLRNTFQAAGADAFDAILGEKLKFDLEVKRNFTKDLPGFLETGTDRLLAVFRRGTADLTAESGRAADLIGGNFNRGFKGVETSAQSLSSNLAGLGVSVGPQSLAALPNQSVATAADQIVSIPGIGFVTQGELDAVNAGQGGGASAFGGGALLGVGALTVLSPEIEQALRGSGRVETPVGSFSATNDPNVGFGAAVGAGLVTGAAVGGVVGAVVGTIVGAVLGVIDELFGASRKSAGDIGGEILNSIAEKNRFILQQDRVEASGRTGIDADVISGTPSFRAAFFTAEGFPINDVLAQGGRFQRGIDDLLNPARGFERTKFLPNGESIVVPAGVGFIEGGELVPNFAGTPAPSKEVADAVLGPSLGLGVLLGQGNASFAVEQANRIANNVLLSGVEFEEEAKRQVRLLAEAAGFDIRTAVEQLATDFTKTGGLNFFPPDLRREQFVSGLEAVVDLLGDDLPAGVDVAAIALKNLGETSANTGVILSELDREIELFGQFADNSRAGFKQGIASELALRSPESLAASGAGIGDIVRAASRRGLGLQSSIQAATLSGVDELLSERVLDLIEPLIDNIGQAVGDGRFSDINAIIGAGIAGTLPQINAQFGALEEFRSQLGILPINLVDQADSIRGQVEDTRFGRLSAKQQRTQVDSEIASLQRRIAGIRSDGIQDGEVSILQELFGELDQLGATRVRLAGDLFSGNTVTARRLRDSFVEESLGIREFAASGFDDLGERQREAFESNTTATVDLIESNGSLGDDIRELNVTIKQALSSGVISETLLAKAVTKIILNDPEARAEFEDSAEGAR